MPDSRLPWETEVCIRHIHDTVRNLRQYHEMAATAQPQYNEDHWDQTNKQTPWPLVRKRTIPTERPPLDEI
jgi:hypothetical protein